MSNCHGCSKPITFKYRTTRGTTEELPDGTTEYVPGPPLLDGQGQAIVEDLCDTCLTASKLNRPEDYYGGCWVDKHGHPSHIVERKPDDYLLA